MKVGFVAFSVLAAAISVLSFGCKSQPKRAVEAKPIPAETMAANSTPPRLAVESFQAAWEIIRDTHFDTNFNGLDWNAVRADFQPRIQKAKSQEEVRDTIQAMLDLLGQSHLMVIPGTPQRIAAMTETNRPPLSATEAIQPPLNDEIGGIGIEIRVVENQIVVFRVEPKSPAEKDGLKPGWIVKSIDGEPAFDPMVDTTELSSREREFLQWHHAANLLKGPVSRRCDLTLNSSVGEEKHVSIPRARESGEPAKLGNLPTLFTRVEIDQFKTTAGKRVGYLRFNLWMPPAIAVINRFIDDHRNSDAIVIDLRGNYGGIGGMVMGVAGHFVNGRASLGKMKMRDNELNFVASPRRVDLQMRPTNTFQGKLAILTDLITLSSAELFAGGMQELGRGRVFGQTTAGQALPAVSDRLPNGDLLYHAVADFTTPKGRRLEGNGVAPDEVILLRLPALQAGTDEPLQAALRWIDSTPQNR